MHIKDKKRFFIFPSEKLILIYFNFTSNSCKYNCKIMLLYCNINFIVL